VSEGFYKKYFHFGDQEPP